MDERAALEQEVAELRTQRDRFREAFLDAEHQRAEAVSVLRGLFHGEPGSRLRATAILLRHHGWDA